MPVWLDPPAITKFAYEQAAGAEHVQPGWATSRTTYGFAFVLPAMCTMV